MTQNVEAIYEKGILRPLQALTLRESQLVRVSVTDQEATNTEADTEFLDQIRAEVATFKHRPTDEETFAASASIPGSLADDVIAERGEYY